jgi:hypothetical protein
MCGVCWDIVNCPISVPNGHCAFTILGIINDTFNGNPDELLDFSILSNIFNTKHEVENKTDVDNHNDSAVEPESSLKRKIKIEIDNDTNVCEDKFADFLVTRSQAKGPKQTANEITKQLLWLSYNERNNLSLDNRESKPSILKRTKRNSN